MARFTALPSDTSEDDEKYVASPPLKPPQPRTNRPPAPSRVQRVDEDAEMASDSGSSRADGEGEEEDEDDEPPSDSPRPSANNHRRAAARAGRGRETHTTEEEEEEEGEESGGSSRSSLEVVILPEHRRGDPSIIPWAQRIGIDPQKMHVMHASLFPGPGPESSAEALKPSNAEKPERVRLTPNGLHRKHSRDSEGDGVRAATQEVCVCFYFSFPFFF